jgi:hypothetical protein
MVDNSQGHSVYAENALVISCMNVRPGGKQAKMHDMWFMKISVRVPQTMVFLLNHADHPNKLKRNARSLERARTSPSWSS